MAYYIVAAGGTLYQLSTAGVATALTLPTGTTLSTTRRSRMAVLGRNLVVVNGTSRSVQVAGDQTVRPLILRPPVSPPIIAAGAAGGYSGTVRCKYTNIIKDPASLQLMAESDFSPVSASVTVVSKLLAVSGLAAAADPQVTHRRLYRTATGPGSAYFQWIDVEANLPTGAISDDTSDALLSLVAAPTGLGSAPGMVPGTFMSIIASWKGHLWGVGDLDVDTLLFSDTGLVYGWPVDNAFDVDPIGSDQFGVTGLLPRRDELGVARRNILWKVIGNDSDSFELVKVVEGKGVWAPDSVVVIRDIAYFLAEDGVYTWGPDGVDCISDQKAKGWFSSDTYFNRSQFANAFGKYNAKFHGYELHLAALGSTDIDRWVFYDIASKTWWGPHKTAAFTPSIGAAMIDSNNLSIPVIGGTDGYLYKQNQAGFVDQASAITLDMITAFHNGATPDIQKLWDDLSLLTKIESAAGNLAIAAKLGGLDAAVAKTYTPDLRKGRERMNSIGPGRLLNLEFTESTSAQGCEIYGYEVPFIELGRQ
jgi:hypothetical protein